MNQITYIPVLDATGRPLAPCSPGKARKLLKRGQAKPCRRWDVFTIQLQSKIVPAENIGQSAIAVNPGPKHTGIAVFRQKPSGQRIPLLALAIHHRGREVKKRMKQRADNRRARRFRLRRRPARYKNRKRLPKWLQPSVKSRMDNTLTWISRLQRLVAIDQTLVETLKFDIQKLQNPHIRGKGYQQGPLYQTTLKAYVFDRDGNKCRYCGKKPTRENPLTKDHVVPIARSGPDRHDNIVAACRQCNMAKGSQAVEEFLKTRKKRLASVLTQLRRPLAAETQHNIIQSQLLKILADQGHHITETSSAETAANRHITNVAKSHGNAAALLGYLTGIANLPPTIQFQALGHGRRQRCMPSKKGGTPRGQAWRQYCQDRNQGLPLPAQPPGHKQRQIRFPNTSGISTGDYVAIRNKNGRFTGYAMLYSQGHRIALAYHHPRVTGYTSSAQLLHRNHGYLRIS